MVQKVYYNKISTTLAHPVSANPFGSQSKLSCDWSHAAKSRATPQQLMPTCKLASFFCEDSSIVNRGKQRQAISHPNLFPHRAQVS